MQQTPGPIPPAQLVITPELARELHLDVGTTSLAVSGDVSEGAERDVSESLAAISDTMEFYVERGYRPDSSALIIQWVLSVLGAVLMLGGTLTATFLALSDAKPDLATLAAVGAPPRTRRGVAASYALAVGLVGAMLGAPVGFIPGIAISRPLTGGLYGGEAHLDVPWLLVGVVVVGLPLLTAAAVGLTARSRLPMVARIEQRSGRIGCSSGAIAPFRGRSLAAHLQSGLTVCFSRSTLAV